MPLSPPLVLEAGSGTKFQLLPLLNIVGPFLGLTRNLGVRQNDAHPTRTKERREVVPLVVGSYFTPQPF
jgi:hypothetical protein